MWLSIDLYGGKIGGWGERGELFLPNPSSLFLYQCMCIYYICINIPLDKIITLNLLHGFTPLGWWGLIEECEVDLVRSTPSVFQLVRSLNSICSKAISLGAPGGNVVTSNSGLIKLAALSPYLVEQSSSLSNRHCSD